MSDVDSDLQSPSPNDDSWIRNALEREFAEENERVRMAEAETAIFTPDLVDWHICRDCVDPLMEFLETAYQEWRSGKIDENELHSKMIFVDIASTDIGFAVVWLQVHVSQSFAEHFERRLTASIQQVKDYAESVADVWSAAPPPKVAEDTMDKFFPDGHSHIPVEQKIQEIWLPDVDTQHKLKDDRERLSRLIIDTVVFLKRLSVILRAKFEGNAIKKQDVEKVRAIDVATDERDKWLYERAVDVVPWAKMVSDLGKECPEQGWSPISTVPGVRDRAIDYAKRNGLPLPPSRRNT